MIENLEQPLRQISCQGENCGALFFICIHCDRGLRYCSSVCQKQARPKQWRAASRRHQQSPQGRLDHRYYQRSYRQRTQMPALQPPQFVTHHSSQAELTHATLHGFRPPIVVKSAIQRLLKSLSDFGLLICQFCEQQGRFVNPFLVPM